MMIGVAVVPAHNDQPASKSAPANEGILCVIRVSNRQRGAGGQKFPVLLDRKRDNPKRRRSPNKRDPEYRTAYPVGRKLIARSTSNPASHPHHLSSIHARSRRHQCVNPAHNYSILPCTARMILMGRSCLMTAICHHLCRAQTSAGFTSTPVCTHRRLGAVLSGATTIGQEMKPITKRIFLDSAVCMTRGWLTRAGVSSAAPTVGDQFRMEQGQAVGQLARELFPEGHLIKPGDMNEAVRQTEAALSNPKVTVLFEAAFRDGDYVVRADILKRCSRGWDVFEVKMSLEGTDSLPELIDDLTYTVMVMRHCGIAVGRCCLMLMSRQFRKGMSSLHTFVEVDQTKEVRQRCKEFASLWGRIHTETSSPEPPIRKLIADCRDCEFFGTHCLGKGVKNPVFCLPNLHRNRIAQLSAASVVSIDAIPKGFPLTDSQKRVVHCIRTRKPYVSSSFRKDLCSVVWPAHYLDFESVMTAIPLYDDIAPFEQITTQYSIHHCSAPGKIIGHSEYLADPSRDCQRELAAQLLADLGDRGSIIVYSHFEAVRIAALAARFPYLAQRLVLLTRRVFDLLPIVRKGLYHHALKSSFSIKALLPAVIPEMSYDELDIADGDTAVARFAWLAMGCCNAKQAQKVRDDLLAYCKRDTLAMVELHHALLKPDG